MEPSLISSVVEKCKPRTHAEWQRSPRPRTTLNSPSGSSFERPTSAGPDRQRCLGRHSSTRSNRACSNGHGGEGRVFASNDSRSFIGYLGNRPPGAPSEPHRSSRCATQRSSASASELHFPHAPFGNPLSSAVDPTEPPAALNRFKVGCGS